jgi:hypothetical protein
MCKLKQEKTECFAANVGRVCPMTQTLGLSPDSAKIWRGFGNRREAHSLPPLMSGERKPQKRQQQAQENDVCAPPHPASASKELSDTAQRVGEKCSLQHLGLMIVGAEMNRGGFSWRRLFGVSAFKARVSRQIGIPLTRPGRRQKLWSLILRLLGQSQLG